MSIFPLILIDTHTTGIPVISKGKAEYPQLLELSAICYEPGKIPDMMNSFQVFIKNDKVKWLNKGAQKMNQWLADEIESGIVASCSPEEASQQFNEWLAKIKFVHDFSEDHKLIAAGRKVDSFDLPILSYNGFNLENLEFKGFDVTSLFYREDLNWLPTVENLFRASGGKRRVGTYAMDSNLKVAHIFSKVNILRAIEDEESA